VGSLRIIREELEAGRLEWEEYSHFGMISRLQAGAAGLPFMPMNQTAAPDLEKNNPNIRRVKDPYSGKEVTTVPALNPDVGIIHVQRADANGNAQVWGILGEQKEAAFASRHVIITAEEIVEEEVIRSDPNRTLIPGIIVNAVCHVPHCAHPSYTQGYYDRDNVFYLNWDKISEDRANVNTWLEEWVYGLKDAGEYWEKLGAETHSRLAVKPRYAAPVNYGDY
jgi:glutaconate CoA-transferase subunit A